MNTKIKHNPFNIFKWTNYRIIINTVIFLLLIPFRLPINILLVKLLNNLSTLVEAEITSNLIVNNIMVSKLILSILLSILFIYNIEHLSRDIKGRKAKNNYDEIILYWWSAFVTILMIAYIIFDMINMYELIPLIIK